MTWVGLSCFASNWVLQFSYLQCSLEDEARKDSTAWTLYYCLPTSAHHPSLLRPLSKIWPRGTFRLGRPVIALLLLVHSVNSLAQTRFSLYCLLSVPDPLVLCCFDAVSFFFLLLSVYSLWALSIQPQLKSWLFGQLFLMSLALKSPPFVLYSWSCVTLCSTTPQSWCCLSIYICLILRVF